MLSLLSVLQSCQIFMLVVLAVPESFDISVRLAISDFLPLSCPLCIRVISAFHTLCSMFSSFRRFVVLSVSSRIVNSTRSRKLCITPVFFSFFSHHLSPMGPINELQRCPSRMGHKGSTHLSPVHAYEFLSRCRFSNLTPRQPMAELFVLASSRFPLRKSEENSLLLRFKLTNTDMVSVDCTH